MLARSGISSSRLAGRPNTPAGCGVAWKRICCRDLGKRPVRNSKRLNAGPPAADSSPWRVETAHRALQNPCPLFRYGVATGRAQRSRRRSTRRIATGSGQTLRRDHRPEDHGALLRDLDGYEGRS